MSPLMHTVRKEVNLNTFLIIPLEGSEWSASNSGHFTKTEL